LKDHCNVQVGALLHWLHPGKELHNVLCVLIDDSSCIQMADKIEEGAVADIYVEARKSEGDVTHESASTVTALTQTIESREKDIQFVRT
jgi:alpha-galactosidase